MKPQKTKQTCSTCKHWKSKQAELEYSQFYGICTCYKWKFDTSVTGDCLVLDRENRSKKTMGVQRFETQKNQVPFGVVESSRYCFVTEEEFGCIHHEKQSNKTN
jgi:nitrite reductase/ring-hydroxylating ferredoxin subunit